MMTTSSLRTGLVALSTCLLLTGAVTDLSAQTSLPPLTIRYVDQILERGDLRTAGALISPGAVLSTPEGEFLGPQGMRQFTAELARSFSDLEFRIDGTQYGDDNLQIDFTLTGTQSGPYQGIPGRCAHVEVAGTALLDLDDGMVDDQWITYDRAEIVRQADRYNQLASAEGITCATSDQGLFDLGADSATSLAAEQDYAAIATELDSAQVSTSDPASPCFQDPNCAPAVDDSADQSSAPVTSEVDVSELDCIHQNLCMLP